MLQLVAIFGFLSVVLRGTTLICEVLLIGGIVFRIVVAPSLDPPWGRRLLLWSAVGLVLSQALFLSANIMILMQSSDMSLGEALGANFVAAGALFIASAVAAGLIAATGRWRAHPAMLIPAGLLLLASVMTSHAVSRLDHRLPLALLTALHQGATAVWIGGLPFLWIALKHAPDAGIARKTSLRFSRLALVCVSLLAVSGVVLAVAYVGSWAALYGTSHGAMVATKVLLFLCLLALGGLNFRIVRRLDADSGHLLRSLRRIAEAEIGIGLAVILAAASLTAQPPGVDLTEGRVTMAEIAARMTPRWPRLRSPSASELTRLSLQVALERAAVGSSAIGSYVPGQEEAETSSPANIAWSEYNHNWAGLVVFLMGILALASRTGHVPWAKNWPMMFLALGVFIFLRADPENWPLGANGFWASFADPEVLQHRAAVLLIVVFAMFEWRVQTGRIISHAALVFPLVCAVGGALLLTHTHSLGNVKEELLAELSHSAIAVLGIVAGWSRWLEIRLPDENRLQTLLSRVWPVCFILVGLVLLNYRES